MEVQCENCGTYFYHPDPYEPPPVEVRLCGNCKELENIDEPSDR